MESLELKMHEGVDPQFWLEKRVLITGHTGFKGSWLSLILQKYEATLCGYSLKPASARGLFEVASIAERMDSVIGDIRDIERLKATFNRFQPEIVIHMAAQPLVRFSYRNPVDTFSTNVMGTVNLLEAARNCASVKAVINVTTDKCYQNKERLWGYREDEPMGGHDPYSSSKGCSELVTAAYRASYFELSNAVSVASARAGNVIGGGDWAEDRLIPDVIGHFESDQSVNIRNPAAIRPWQHVLEPLSGYLMLAERLYSEGQGFSQAWNFGPRDDDVRPVAEIVEYMACKWSDDAAWHSDKTEQPHEAQLLRLDITKARHLLGWTPKWNLEMALDSIIEWHQRLQAGDDMRAVTLAQINQYEHT